MDVRGVGFESRESLEEKMERTAVKSQDIAIVGYDQETATLEIVFRRGGVYHYSGISEAVYKSLMASPSCGTYFNQKIKDQYSYTKVS